MNDHKKKLNEKTNALEILEKQFEMIQLQSERKIDNIPDDQESFLKSQGSMFIFEDGEPSSQSLLS